VCLSFFVVRSRLTRKSSAAADDSEASKQKSALGRRGESKRRAAVGCSAWLDDLSATEQRVVAKLLKNIEENPEDSELIREYKEFTEAMLARAQALYA
jgi:hypothetical protein